MAFKQTLLVLILATVFPTVVFAQVADKSKVRTYELRTTYGTLIYEGKVKRTENEKEYKFLIEKLKLTFDPTAEFNRTDKIVVKEIEIVATKKPGKGDGPWTILFRDKKRTTIVLSKKSRTATLKKITLVVPKMIYDKADHVGLSITDGRWLWPSSKDLKVE